MMCYSYNISENFQSQYAELSDDELAVRARNDSSAAAVLIARVAPPIRALAHSIDPLVSEDLLQEGLMAALAAIEKYDPERGKAQTFLVQCAKNRMLSVVRRIKPIGGEGEDALDKLEDPTEAEKGRFDVLYSAIERCLSELERGTVSLYLAGLGYKEIADRLGISEKSVDNAMQRARRKLREEFEKGTDL